WACELAIGQHAAFVRGPAGARRMYWKMSIDLTRPLVVSSGQHDALDGWVACARLLHDARLAGDGAHAPALRSAVIDLASTIQLRALPTSDPLGIGALLVAARQLAALDPPSPPVTVAQLLEAAAIGISRHVASSGLRGPPDDRLAFRELGLAIGLRADECIR